MANMRVDSLRLANLIGDRVANGERQFLKRRVRVHVEITNGADRYALFVAEENIVLKSALFIPDTTVAAGAASLDFQLKKHDGAGGAQTALSALYDGTASAMTADQKNNFAGVDGDTVASGNVVEVEVTVNGAGGAPGTCLFEIEYEYND